MEMVDDLKKVQIEFTYEEAESLLADLCSEFEDRKVPKQVVKLRDLLDEYVNT